MKFCNVLIVVIFAISLFAQNFKRPEFHIDVEHNHDSNNCIGYALGRAEGKTKEAPYCDPCETFADRIPDKYPFYTTVTNVQVGDILAWGGFDNNPHGDHNGDGHVAYVVEVQDHLNSSNISDIRVDQVPGLNGSEQTHIKVSEVSPNDPVGYFNVPRGNKINVTLANDFGGGNLEWRSSSGGPVPKGEKADTLWNPVSHGFRKYCYYGEFIDVRALEEQEFQGKTYSFLYWLVNNHIRDPRTLENKRITKSTIYDAQTDYVEPVDPLSVDVTGPTYLVGQEFSKAPEYHATGTWEAAVNGGTGTYEYQWYKRTCTQPVPKGTKQVKDKSDWYKLIGETNNTLTETIYYNQWGRDLKCIVNSDNQQEEDQIHVYVTGDEPVQKSTTPTSISLESNSPNPFNPSTNIKFGIPKTQQVELIIYSITGEKVRTLINSNMSAGYHTINWNATDDFGAKVSSGVYIYQLRCGKQVLNKKMFFIK